MKMQRRTGDNGVERILQSKVNQGGNAGISGPSWGGCIGFFYILGNYNNLW